MSSAKRVCPVHFARASTLRKGLPMTLCCLPLLPLAVFIFIKSRGPVRTSSPPKTQSHEAEPSQSTFTRCPLVLLGAFVPWWQTSFSSLLHFKSVNTLPRGFGLFSSHHCGGQFDRF